MYIPTYLYIYIYIKHAVISTHMHVHKRVWADTLTCTDNENKIKQINPSLIMNEKINLFSKLFHFLFDECFLTSLATISYKRLEI